ncbi:MAG: HEAT repeat domain-containing protein [Planctomycetes bacterium]|nr:HEAT repeat domain-containing protein [Planctomycetota bacterium]
MIYRISTITILFVLTGLLCDSAHGHGENFRDWTPRPPRPENQRPPRPEVRQNPQPSPAGAPEVVHVPPPREVYGLPPAPEAVRSPVVSGTAESTPVAQDSSHEAVTTTSGEPLPSETFAQTTPSSQDSSQTSSPTRSQAPEISSAAPRATTLPASPARPFDVSSMPSTVDSISDVRSTWRGWWNSGNREQFVAFGEPSEDGDYRGFFEIAKQDADAEIRAAAATGIGQWGGSESRTMLENLLADESTKVRASANLALGMLGEIEAATQIEARILDSSEDLIVRCYGLVGLGFLAEREKQRGVSPEEILRVIRRALEDSSARPEILIAAMSAAEISKDLSASESIRALTSHYSYDVSAHAFCALGKIGGANNADFLSSKFEDQLLRTSSRQAIAIALGALAADYPSRISAERTLVKIYPVSADSEKDAFTRQMMMVALARSIGAAPRLAAGIADALEYYVEQGETEDRGYAAISMAIMSQNRTMPAQLVERFVQKLSRKLTGGNEVEASVLSACAISLGMIAPNRGEATFSAVRDILKARAQYRAEAADVRRSCLTAMAIAHRNTAFPWRAEDFEFFRVQLAGGNADVAEAASLGLAILQNSAEIPDEVRLSTLDSSDATIRAAAAQGFGIARCKSSANVLLERFALETDYPVRLNIVRGISEIASKFGCSARSLTARNQHFRVNGNMLRELY